eukprot:8254811-Karenia_brevis.AAC.1
MLHVKGHSGSVLNDEADNLAKCGARNIKPSRNMYFDHNVEPVFFMHSNSQSDDQARSENAIDELNQGAGLSADWLNALQ